MPFNQEIFDLIHSHFPMFTEPEFQKEISDVGNIYHFKQGEIIMDFGSYIRMVPLVIKGTVKVMREAPDQDYELFLYYLYTGETCSVSYSCCMAKKKSDIRTIAEEDVTLIGIPLKYADLWMSKYTSWRQFVLSSYDSRMHEMLATIDNIAFKKMNVRLLEYIKEKASAHQSRFVYATHGEIASDLNASREAISRLLKKFEKQGVVELGRNRIKLL